MIRFVRDIVRVLNMPCREHAGLLSRRLDGQLSSGEALGLRVHLLYCAGCRRLAAQLHTLRKLGRELGEQMGTGEGLPGAVRDRVIARVQQASQKN